jgi:hypothetical protein
MKKLILSLACAAPLVFAGCGTLNPSQAATAQKIIRATVPIGVEIAVLREPRVVPYLRASADAVDIAASDPQIAPGVLLSDLQKTTVNLFKTEIAEIAILGGVNIFEVFLADKVAADTNIVAVLMTLSDSIRAGLPPVTSTVGFKSKVKKQGFMLNCPKTCIK